MAFMAAIRPKYVYYAGHGPVANDGYLVIAPDHQDSRTAGFITIAPEKSFRDPKSWDENIF